MSPSDTIGNLGIPLGSDLGAIVRELSAITAVPAQGAQEPAAIRACSCNLIIVAADQNEAQSLPAVLADVAESHPCRSLIAFARDVNGAVKTPLEAWALDQCRQQPGGGPQVCSEVITLAVNRESAAGLANAVLSLLVADLPVFLYWRSAKPEDWNLVQTLTRAAHVVIVDSRTALTTSDEGRTALDLLSDLPEGVELRDLTWQRLTPWRDLIAQFFDTEAARNLLRDLTAVEIRGRTLPGEKYSYPAVLLGGWLSSRLGWRVVSSEKDGATWISHQAGPSGSVTLNIHSTPADTAEPGLAQVELRTKGNASFLVVADHEKKCLTATAASPGRAVMHTVPFEPMAEADQLIAELLVLGEDTGFRDAFRAATLLAGSQLPPA